MSARPFVLVILDGFGYRPEPAHNAIAAANTPNWDHYWQTAPHVLIDGSGIAVGLPEGQMGNSEVGHMTIGAGRVMYQQLSLIDQAIAEGSFFTNAVLTQLCSAVCADSGTLHVIGLLSDGGVHSHIQHFEALIALAAQSGVNRLEIHVCLDGRDTAPQSAHDFITQLETACEQHHIGRIASVMGRYYGMDRDQRWDRTAIAYDFLTKGQSSFTAPTALAALEAAYARGETDEFVQPTWITAPACFQNRDGLLCLNFRADRMRQLMRALTAHTFSEFKRTQVIAFSAVVTLTEYAKDLSAKVAFPAVVPVHTLSEWLSEHGLRQLHVAETEKYAHVTFFFGGGVESPYPGEDRVLVPSPKVSTYDTCPAMSAREVTQVVVQAIQAQTYDFIVVNFANPDMVGHTGVFDAAVFAIETIDTCLGDIAQALQSAGGEMIVTSDHGNAECMYDEVRHQPHTAHTTALVPLVYIGGNAQATQTQGTLADIAPTILSLMGLSIPSEMTGHVLITRT